MQSAAVSNAIASYESSLIHGPVATSLAIEVGLQLPATELPSIISNIGELIPTPSGNIYSWATAPPSTFSTPSWATQLDAGGRSDLVALRTSVVGAEASIVRSVLSITTAQATAIGTAVASASRIANNAADVRLNTGKAAVGLGVFLGAAALL